MLSAFWRALDAPRVAAPMEIRTGAKDSADRAVAAIGADLARLVPPANPASAPVLIEQVGADGRGHTAHFQTATGEVEYHAGTPQADGRFPLVRDGVVVFGVWLRALAFRVVSPRPGVFSLEVALEACDDQGRDHEQRLDVRVLQTSTRLK